MTPIIQNSDQVFVVGLGALTGSQRVATRRESEKLNAPVAEIAGRMSLRGISRLGRGIRIVNGPHLPQLQEPGLVLKYRIR